MFGQYAVNSENMQMLHNYLSSLSKVCKEYLPDEKIILIFSRNKSIFLKTLKIWNEMNI